MNKSDQIVRAYPKLRNYAFYLTEKNKFEAEDLLQDTMVKIIEKLHKFDDEEYSNVAGWGMSIMHNIFIDAKRKAKQFIDKTTQISKIERFDYPDAFYTPRDTILRERIRYIKDKLNTKPNQEFRKIFILRSFGLSYKEIANFSNITETNVKGRIHKMRLELQNLNLSTVN